MVGILKHGKNVPINKLKDKETTYHKLADNKLWLDLDILK